MLTTADRYIGTAPFLALFPGLAIVIIVLGFNLIGDALPKRSIRSCAGMTDGALLVSDLRVEFGTERARSTPSTASRSRSSNGETLGIVGESGCGKSVTALACSGCSLAPVGHSGEAMLRRRDLLQMADGDAGRCAARTSR